MNDTFTHIKEFVDLYSDPTIICDFDGNILHKNPAFSNIRSINKKELRNIDNLLTTVNLSTLSGNYHNWLNELKDQKNEPAKERLFKLDDEFHTTDIKSTVIDNIIINILNIKTGLPFDHRFYNDEDLCPIAICRITTFGKVLQCNTAFCRLMECDRNEIEGSNFESFLILPWNKFDLSRYHTLLRTGQISGDEKDIATKTGKQKHIEFFCTLDIRSNDEINILIHINEMTNTKRRLSVLEAKEQTLRSVFAKIYDETGTVFFEKLVLELNKILKCEFSFVGKNCDNKDQMQIIAGAHDDKLLPSFIHWIPGSPCEEIEQKGISLHINNAANRFPSDPFISTNKIQGYIGMPLVNSKGVLIGAIASASPKPLSNIPLAESLMQILSYRIISEIEKNELFEQIKKSELKFRTLFETSPFPIMITDTTKETRLLDINEEFLRKSGKERKNIIGKRFSEINVVLPSINASDISSAVKKAGKLYHYEIKAINAQGEYRYCKVASILTRLNETDCIVTYIRDIHEEKMANIRLIESEEIFRSLFKHANDIIFILKPDLTIIDCNPASQLFFGYSKDQIVGKNPLDFSQKIQQDGELASTTIYKYAEMALQGSTQRFEWIHTRKNGGSAIADISLIRFLIKGQPFLQAIVREMTEQKKIQADIYNAVIKAEESERMRFARELHDGISPLLSTVKLYSQSFVSSSNIDFQKELSKRIEVTVEEAILSLSEISNKLSPHVLQNFGLTEAIKIFTNNIRKATSIDIQFESNLEERLSENIEITFYRSLTELMNNTIKHAKATTATIKLTIDKNLTLTYSDNGIGFDKTLVSSKGMGMFNLKNRIQSLGGSFDIYSKPSEGFLAIIKAPIEEIAH